MLRNSIIILLIVLVGCYPARRASKQVAKAAITYPEQTAKQLRLLWPLDTTLRDTTIIEGDHAGYDAMIASLSEALQAQDSLINALAKDTGCAEYVRIVEPVRAKVKAVVPVQKPRTMVVTNTVQDRAAIAACEAERNKALDIAAKAQFNADSWHKTAKQRGYVMYSALGLILLFVAYKVIRLIK